MTLFPADSSPALPVRVLLPFAILAMTACATVAPAPEATRSGEVGVRGISLTAAAGNRLAVADNEDFQMPLAEAGNGLPDYPAQLLSQRLPPQALCLQVGIDAAGAVMGTWPITDKPDMPDCAGGDVDRAFFDAAVRAVTGWRFDPAFRCVYPDKATKENHPHDCRGGQEIAQPVSLAYRFVFEQRDGRGSVRLGR